MSTLWTVGYGAWPAAKRLESLLAALKSTGATVLVDTRHSPCASALKTESLYGPKRWNLQAEGGFREALEEAGIRYVWLVELGNPQKNDPQMTILKRHLADKGADWPVHRGLALLADLVRENPTGCAILCACEHYRRCHRRLIAEALRNEHFGGELGIKQIPADRDLRIDPRTGSQRRK